MRHRPQGSDDARSSQSVDAQPQNFLFVTHSAPEAIFLSDRIVVMGPCPGHVKTIIEIEQPRPRRLAIHSGDEFLPYTEDILAIFESLGVIREDGNLVRLAKGCVPNNEDVRHAAQGRDPCH